MNAATKLLIIGIVLMLGSCVPYGLAIKHGLTKNIAYTSSLEEDHSLRTKLFEVDTQQLVQVAVKLDIQMPSIEKETGTNDYEARYNFPFTYRIIDENNKLIYQENSGIDWESGTRITTNKVVGPYSTTLTVKRNFTKLNIDPPGKIKLEASLDADSTYEANTSIATLLVYDNVHTYWQNILQGLGLSLLGLCLAVISIIMFAARTSKTSGLPGRTEPAVIQMTKPQMNTGLTTEQQAASSDQDKDARKWAMFTHLSAYSGFIVPFGGLIAPLVIWLLKKDEFHLVDINGREALNFRISMYIYTLISVILIFVLVGFVLLAVLFLIDLIIPLVAGLKANDGEKYRYPITIRFFKEPDQV